jgi:hypothetical protein
MDISSGNMATLKANFIVVLLFIFQPNAMVTCHKSNDALAKATFYSINITDKKCPCFCGQVDYMVRMVRFVSGTSRISEVVCILSESDNNFPKYLKSCADCLYVHEM